MVARILMVGLVWPACVLFPPASFADEPPAWGAPGPHAVARWDTEWHDARRARKLPVRIYYPKQADSPRPVIIFSHGLGGSREGYSYLGEHWASHGYISLHLQHPGSDREIFAGMRRPAEIQAALKKSAADLTNSVHRPLDVRFAIDQLEELSGARRAADNRAGPPDKTPSPARIRAGSENEGFLPDLARIGVAGHSFGAYTTMAVAGQQAVGPRIGQRSLGADPRVKAAIPMSAPVPRAGADYDKVYSAVRIPCFHMTGTLDDSPINDTTAAQRRIPYDHCKNSPQYLITFTGGDHMIFSGRGNPLRPAGRDAEFQAHIKAASTAFWEAWLRDNADARAWLEGGGLKRSLGEAGVFEQRGPAAP